MNSQPEFYSILAAVVFGAIGAAAFLYGRKQSSWKPMVIGVCLMGEGYFLKDPVWAWGVGSALTACLWFFRNG